MIVPRELPGVPPPKLKPIALGDATRLRKGSFLVALGNPFNAARDGRPSASWGILANVARRLEPSSEDDQMNAQRPAPPLPDPAPARRQAQPRHERRRGDQPQGGAGRPHHRRRQRRRVRRAGRLRDPDGRDGPPRGRDAQAGQGGTSTASSASGSTEQGTNRVACGAARAPRPTRRPAQVDDEIVAVGDIPVTDADAPGRWRSTPCPPARRSASRSSAADEVLERTVELAKYRVDGEVIATNRPAPWRGLRVDYTSTLPQHDLRLRHARAPWSRGGVVVAEVEPGSPAAKAGLKRDQVIRRVGGQRRPQPPRVRPGRRRPRRPGQPRDRPRGR